MKIGIIVPGENQLATAGVRIRYGRLMPRLAENDHQMEIIPIDQIRSVDSLDADAYVFCKCHDARSLLLAGMMRRHGLRVGIDVFDDYYSQVSNPRFVHLREWVRAIASDLAFVLCSTPRMKDVLGTVLPGKPCFVVNDPYDVFDASAIAAAAEASAERARRTRVLDVVWFGMGDNPHHVVGLQDLVAFAGEIRAARRFGYTPRLTILTNRRALVTDRLERIARIGLPFHLEEWSEALERETIKRSTVSFLPVNARPFSVVKSLNRAVTALTAGSQVLSPGFPLYADLAPFVYDRTERLIADLEAGRPALRADTVGALGERLARLADPAAESSGLVAFLARVPAPAREAGAARFAVVHGANSVGIVHKRVQQLGHLSVASPACELAVSFDLKFERDPVDGTPGLLLSSRAASLLEDGLAQRLGPPETVGKAVFRRLPAAALPEFPPDEVLFRTPASGWRTLLLAEYELIMDRTERILLRLFGPLRVLKSEFASPYLSRVSGTAAAAPVEPARDVA